MSPFLHSPSRAELLNNLQALRKHIIQESAFALCLRALQLRAGCPGDTAAGCTRVPWAPYPADKSDGVSHAWSELNLEGTSAPGHA